MSWSQRISGKAESLVNKEVAKATADGESEDYIDALKRNLRVVENLFRMYPLGTSVERIQYDWKKECKAGNTDVDFNRPSLKKPASDDQVRANIIPLLTTMNKRAPTEEEIDEFMRKYRAQKAAAAASE